MSNMVLMVKNDHQRLVHPANVRAYRLQGWSVVDLSATAVPDLVAPVTHVTSVLLASEEPEPVPPVAVETPKATKALVKKSTRKSS
jgi:hypothetical protein